MKKKLIVFVFFFVHILGVACCVVVEVRVMLVGICDQIQTQPFHFVVVDVICWCEKGDLSYCGWGDNCRLLWSWLWVWR